MRRREDEPAAVLCTRVGRGSPAAVCEACHDRQGGRCPFKHAPGVQRSGRHTLRRAADGALRPQFIRGYATRPPKRMESNAELNPRASTPGPGRGRGAGTAHPPQRPEPVPHRSHAHPGRQAPCPDYFGAEEAHEASGCSRHGRTLLCQVKLRSVTGKRRHSLTGVRSLVTRFTLGCHGPRNHVLLPAWMTLAFAANHL